MDPEFDAIFNAFCMLQRAYLNAPEKLPAWRNRLDAMDVQSLTDGADMAHEALCGELDLLIGAYMSCAMFAASLPPRN